MAITKTLRSQPDPHTQQVTLLDITKGDDGTMTVSVKLRLPNQQTIEISRANIDALFAIRFTKHNLGGDATIPNWAHWGYVEYKPSARTARVVPEMKDTTAFGAPAVALEYKGVGYNIDTSGRPAELPSYVQDLKQGVNLQNLSKIDVTVTISPAQHPNRTFNYGWINFDIWHSYPPEFPPPDAPAAKTEAWEERIIYPALKFTWPDVANFQPLLSKLGYGAFYKVQVNTGAPNHAHGIAIHADDERGHHKDSSYSNSELAFHLLNPIHLKDTPGGKAYVKPPDYTMAKGDNYGYGGNQMVYRLRAFEIVGVREQVPVDWRDVLHIYRRWIKDRKPLFYRKYRTRGTNGPVDYMAPYAVITNFSTEGPVEVSTDPKLAAWLEKHPAKDGEPNVPNNTNESFLSLLKRLRSRFNVWWGWEDLGGGLKATPAVSSWGVNRLDCFVWGTDDQLHQRTFDGAWRNWQPLPPLQGGLTSAPAAVSWGDNRIDVFVRGTDNQLHQRTFDGAWRNWQPLPPLQGGLTSGPAASSWGPNRLDVFARGTDNGLWHKTFDGVWRDWESLGGVLQSAPAAVSWGPNHIDCFVKGTDNNVYQIVFDGSRWSGWRSLGMPSSTINVSSAPAVCSWGPNRLDLFVRGTDNALWRRIFDGAWGAWERIGGNFQNAPAVASLRPDRIDCFVRSLPNSTLSHLWSDLATPLEAQIWDFEMAGLYHFYGAFPPVADVLSTPVRFKRGMDELVNNGIVPIFTTDPLKPLLNRKRFRGHIIADAAGGWKLAIPHPFPLAMKNRTCAATDVTIKKNNLNFKTNRVWFVHNEPDITLTPAPKPIPSCSDTATVLASRKLDKYGRGPIVPPAALGNGFYKCLHAWICPTKAVEDIYLNSWLQNGLFASGARLIEFMKHSFYAESFCYNKNHQHIVPPDPLEPPDPSEPPEPPSLPYTTVIGSGFWYIRRCRSTLRGVQNRGLAKYGSFSLTVEGTAAEAMLPYVDEHYSFDPHVHFVYSNMVTAKIGPFTDWTVHAGYKEKRKNPLFRIPPTDMLSSARDDEPQPMTDAALKVSFIKWRDMCVNYFNANFVISEPGLAPRNYATVTPNSQDAPATYSYCRGIQDTFNLRGRIFEVGARAVEGLRISTPSVYMEEPYDYNEEVVNFASRAVEMQFRHREFFRGGFMLGETYFSQYKEDGQPFNTTTLWAWGSNYCHPARNFYDVPELVDKIKAEDVYLGTEYRGTSDVFPIRDFISLPADREIYYYKKVLPNGQVTFIEYFRNKIAIYPRVPHLIWQIGDAEPIKVLYLFANVSNSPVQVEFHYDKGLAVPPGIEWSKTMTWISSDGTSQVSAMIKFGRKERQTIPPRSFMTIVLEK